MNLEDFAARTDLLSKTELEKTALLAFYQLEVLSRPQFTLEDIRSFFDTLHLGTPNIYRLKEKVKKSPDFIKGTSTNLFSLHAKTIQRLRTAFPNLNEQKTNIVFTGCILPPDLFLGTRGYVEQLAKQINAAYDHHLYDACAVLMRRLVEVLLIHSYQNCGVESVITNPDGSYKDLKVIIDDIQSNKTVALSKDTRKCVGSFRMLGNFSAHKITYNCRKDDIKNVSLEYRASIEELLYKGGLRT